MLSLNPLLTLVERGEALAERLQVLGGLLRSVSVHAPLGVIPTAESLSSHARGYSAQRRFQEKHGGHVGAVNPLISHATAGASSLQDGGHTAVRGGAWREEMPHRQLIG